MFLILLHQLDLIHMKYKLYNLIFNFDAKVRIQKSKPLMN